MDVNHLWGDIIPIHSFCNGAAGPCSNPFNRAFYTCMHMYREYRPTAVCTLSAMPYPDETQAHRKRTHSTQAQKLNEEFTTKGGVIIGKNFTWEPKKVAQAHKSHSRWKSEMTHGPSIKLSSAVPCNA